MKNIVKSLVLSSMLVLFVNCSDDNNSNQIVDPGFQPNGQDLKNLFASNLNNITQRTSFDSEQDFSFISEKGTLITINANCLKRQDDTPVTGQVDFAFVEIFDRGTMLTTNKPTVGLFGDEKRLLYSGGEFYVEVTQNGEKLKSDCGYMLSTPTSNTGDVDYEMRSFYGEINSQGELLWNLSITGGEMWIGYNELINTDAYNAFVNNFGWYNCDRFVDLGNGFTTVNFSVPTGFANNSVVFLATKNEPNSLAYAYTNMPVGLEVYYVLVTANNGRFKYAIKPSQVITPNLNVTFSLSEMQDGTTQQLVDALNNLP
ncbi:hypothetical protein [Flavobacterium sp. I3-2]|uniref:hypothetical protein n=1 Tax=Flavobacterium sp. I3-2 TaxID=2748319 RepID=UPI0015ADEF1E|nr:hypothetical protein [Flavobacterium sp. I3-2]